MDGERGGNGEALVDEGRATVVGRDEEKQGGPFFSLDAVDEDFEGLG